jgi:hypothetical protein
MKKETLEEAATNYANKELSNELTSKVGNFYGFSSSFIAGAKWQKERSYSEEEVIAFANYCVELQYNSFKTGEDIEVESMEDLLEQFKKK